MFKVGDVTAAAAATLRLNKLLFVSSEMSDGWRHHLPALPSILEPPSEQLLASSPDHVPLSSAAECFSASVWG